MGEALIFQKYNGSSEELFATISVTYPSGSTCTCTKGSRTLTDTNTNGTAVFAIPESGTWTVSCTDGNNTASKSVSVTTKGGNSSVALVYPLILWDMSAGGDNSSITGGWVSNAVRYESIYGIDVAISPTATKNSNGSITVRDPNTSGSTGKSGLWRTAKQINFTNYSKLMFTGTTSYEFWNRAAIFSSPTEWVKDRTVATTALSSTSYNKVNLINLSSVNGNYYFGFFVGGLKQITVQKIWLEP